MKQLPVLIVSIFIVITLHAQSPFLTNYTSVNDTVVARYNRGDYKGIYAMTGPAYKKNTREGGLVSDLMDNKKFTGNIVSAEMSDNLGKVVHFRWRGEKADLNFELWLEGTSIVRFKFNDFIRQPAWPERAIPTDNPFKTALDSIVHKYASIYMSNPKAAALSIGIYSAGKIHQYNYGEIEKGSGKVPDKQSIYTLGSVTKTFIGLLLSRAVTEHKLNLNDDIRKYLAGSFPNLEYGHHSVRLVDLATHSWGFGRFRINVFPPIYETMSPAEQLRYYESYTRDSLYRDLHLVKLDTVPGTRYHYNIGGMLLIGLALEKVYHQPLDKIVRNYFGNALGMKDTKLISDPADLMHFASGYNENGDLMPKMPGMTPSLYTMKTTTTDMLEYLKANIEEKLPEIVLSHQPQWGDPQSFSLGLFWQVTDDYEKGRWIKHSGFDYGSITLCSLHPKEKLGMIVWASDDSRQNNLFDLERSIREAIQSQVTKQSK